MKTLITAVVLVAILAVVTWAGIWLWTNIGGQLTVHGWAALALGVGATIVVGCGLMALAFYSSRRGHDEPPTYRG